MTSFERASTIVGRFEKRAVSFARMRAVRTLVIAKGKKNKMRRYERRRVWREEDKDTKNKKRKKEIKNERKKEITQKKIIRD